MKKDKKQQGSLLIEMVAVIGLLALITPILFQQIQRRNEDLVDIQVAEEIRTLKDAATTYIQAHETELAKGCDLWDSGKETYRNLSTPTACGMHSIHALDSYLPPQTDLSDGGISPQDYELHFYGYTIPTETSYTPVIFALIVQQKGTEFNLRRASKIASLIGVEGGVVTSSKGSDFIVEGVQGMWSIDLAGTSDATINSVAAITSFGNITATDLLKDMKWDHISSNTLETKEAIIEELGIQDLLTVDNKDSDDTNNCIINKTTPAVTVNGQETADTCLPFFEVNPATKEVFVGGAIKFSGSPELEKTCAEKINEETCIATSGCFWEDTTCKGTYVIDPAYTSVINDVRLTSRGGAKLSEILPNWILKDLQKIETTPTEFDIPACPKGYNPAITLSQVSSPKQLSVEGNKVKGDLRLKISATSGSTFTGLKEETGTGTQNWVIRAEERKADGKWGPVDENSEVHALAHLYCVWHPTEKKPKSDRTNE